MAEIIEFGEVRLQRQHNKLCLHRHLMYDRAGRTVQCKDCGRHVDSFDAFLRLIDQYDLAMRRLDTRRAEIEEAKIHNLRLIAARKVDKAWSKRAMVPACPHCGHGIFPDDGFGDTLLGKDYARARLAKQLEADRD